MVVRIAAHRRDLRCPDHRILDVDGCIAVDPDYLHIGLGAMFGTQPCNAVLERDGLDSSGHHDDGHAIALRRSLADDAVVAEVRRIELPDDQPVRVCRRHAATASVAGSVRPSHRLA